LKNHSRGFYSKKEGGFGTASSSWAPSLQCNQVGPCIPVCTQTWSWGFGTPGPKNNFCSSLMTCVASVYRWADCSLHKDSSHRGKQVRVQPLALSGVCAFWPRSSFPCKEVCQKWTAASQRADVLRLCTRSLDGHCFHGLRVNKTDGHSSPAGGEGE
jgi:hypothetical protein